MNSEDNRPKYFSAVEKNSFAEFTADNRFGKIFKSYCSDGYEEFLDKTLAEVFFLSENFQTKNFQDDNRSLFDIKIDNTKKWIKDLSDRNNPYYQILKDFDMALTKMADSKFMPYQSDVINQFYDEHYCLSPIFTMREILRLGPFLESEILFYHAILAQNKYSFDCNGYDFYSADKNDSVLQGKDKFVEKLNILIPDKKNDNEDKNCQELNRRQFSEALLYNLSANTSDLSQLNYKVRMEYKTDDLNILQDDSDALYKYLVLMKKNKSNFPSSKRRCDIVCDNAGKELFSDLYLACYFLYNDIFDKAVFHLKSYPFFVSDATRNDFEFLIKTIQQEYHGAGVQQCLQYIRENKIIIKNDLFWTRPLCFKDMEQENNELYQDMSSSKLVVVKGDLNYRRLVEDKSWDYTDTFDERTRNVFNKESESAVPILAPRVLKSDLLVGISDEAYHFAESRDPKNTTADCRFKGNGKWAVIHFRH